jgi:hypothetical protein
MSAVEKFPILLSEAEEESSAVPPCFSHEGINVCETHAKPALHGLRSFRRSPQRTSSPIRTSYFGSRAHRECRIWLCYFSVIV